MFKSKTRPRFYPRRPKFLESRHQLDPYSTDQDSLDLIDQNKISIDRDSCKIRFPIHCSQLFWSRVLGFQTRYKSNLGQVFIDFLRVVYCTQTLEIFQAFVKHQLENQVQSSKDPMIKVKLLQSGYIKVASVNLQMSTWNCEREVQVQQSTKIEESMQGRLKASRTCTPKKKRVLRLPKYWDSRNPT